MRAKLRTKILKFVGPLQANNDQRKHTMTLSTHQEELLNREREAFVEMFEHEENMKGSVNRSAAEDEWEDPDALLVHDWDLEEMIDDMNAWECELAIQEHLSIHD